MKQKELRLKLSRLQSRIDNLKNDIERLIAELDKEELIE